MEQQRRLLTRWRKGLKSGSGSDQTGLLVRSILMMMLGSVLTLTVLQFSSGSSSSTTELSSSSTVATTRLRSTVSDQMEGWNPIHVFYGKMNHITDPIPEKWWLSTSPKHQSGKGWFAQHGQDVAIAKVFDFKKNGFFVDLAANDAVWASNTFSLEQNFGWKGICIEANPMYWYRLSFRKCHAVGSIVGGKDFEEINVVLSNRKEFGPLGGIVGKDFDNKNAKDAEPRYTASLKTILGMFDAPTVIDYLSLDVEGAELFIMKDFPFHEYTFVTMTVERPSEELQAIFRKNGYEKVLDMKRGDTLWVHKTKFEEAKRNLAKNPEEIDAHQVKQFP